MALLDALIAQSQHSAMDSKSPLRLIALWTISSALSVVAAGATTLADESPFLPRVSAGSPGTAEGTDVLELRGVMSGSFGYLYYVYDPLKKRGVWAGSNDTDNPFIIVAEDAKAGYIEVRIDDGRLLHMKLREAKIQSAEIDAGAAPGSVARALVAPTRAPVGLNRVQAAWQEELNRRLAENAASN
jgi:hypothetical protein